MYIAEHKIEEPTYYNFLQNITLHNLQILSYTLWIPRLQILQSRILSIRFNSQVENDYSISSIN